jgi:hypothetical protein
MKNFNIHLPPRFLNAQDASDFMIGKSDKSIPPYIEKDGMGVHNPAYLDAPFELECRFVPVKRGRK